MLNGISWSLYLAGAGVLLTGYYLAAGLFLYRQEIQRLLRNGRRAAGKEAAENIGGDAQHFLSYEELGHVASVIRHGILEEAGKAASKQDLLRQINASLATYGGLRQPASRGALNNYIVQQAQEICGVEIQEEELEQEWKPCPGDTGTSGTGSTLPASCLGKATAKIVSLFNTKRT